MESKHILIVGGGTAGWMSALLFQRLFSDFSVTLVESADVGIIGVGEGSTPALKAFMDAMGIEESEWMPRCNATYKSGITFRNWSTKKGFTDYFHPFFSHFDRDYIKALDFNSQLRRAGTDVHAHPDAFSYAHYLANSKLCPRTPYSFPFEVQYGYHFNAGLLGELLKEKALERGVVRKELHVADVVLDSTGDVAHLVSEDGEVLEADFFVDCSGFASLITQKALGTGFVSFADHLFNDRAVTIMTPAEQEASNQTISTAMNCGWAWYIPLKDRVGNGYVYSSRYCSEEEAEAELRAHLGVGPEVGARHLKMRVGRAKSMWNRNSLAVGLSQGFLEPLEATALALVQLSLTRFAKMYKAGGFTNQYADTFNAEICTAFDEVKNYLQTHFLTSDREDTEYWRDCRRNTANVSDRLKAVFKAWYDNVDFRKALKDADMDRYYKFNSWVYLFAGMGIFPDESQLKPAEPAQLQLVPMGVITDFFERCMLNHIPQAEALDVLQSGEIPLRSEKESKMGDDEALVRLLGLNFGRSS